MTTPDLGEAFFEEAAGGAPASPPQPAPSTPQATTTTQQARPAAPSLAPTAHDYGEAFFEEAAGGPSATSQAAQRAGGAPAAPTSTPLVTAYQPDADPNSYSGDGSMPPDVAQPGLEAVGLGAAKGVFNTKDFLATGMGIWGDTPADAARSSFRQFVDARSGQNSQQFGFGYDLAEGLAQGAIGLLGAGKIEALGAVGSAAVTTLRATAAFEPHAQNFANLAQAVPGMNGPVTRFMASDPSDSTFAGYMKNALTSIGIEGAAAGLFTGTAAMVKALSGGDSAVIAAAHADLEKALEEHLATTFGGDGSPHLRATLEETPLPGVTPGATSAGEREAGPQTLDHAQAPSYSANSTGLTPSANDVVTGSAEASPSDFGRAPPPTLGANAPAPFSVDTDAIERMLGAWGKDEDALVRYGSWDAAIANGHTFGGGDKIPWQVLATGADGQPSTSMDAFLAQVSAGYAKLGDGVKGGAVQTDAANMQAVERRVQLWNEDPATALGALQAAGERAGSLRAGMSASFAIANRCMQDTGAMAARIQLGDFSEWGGSRAAAVAALKEQTGIAATLLASAQSIRSNSARAMRGMRSEFALGPAMVRGRASLDGDALVSVLANAQGNPAALKAALQPGTLTRLVDGLQLYLVNNMLWNPLTHAIIFGSNAWQTLARPAMRAGGSLVNGSFDSVGREALSSYYYLATSVPDAFRSAVQAFKTGDSIIAPHNLTVSAAGDAVSGGAQAGTSLSQAIAQATYRPISNLGDIFANTMLAAQKAGTFPTRGVGFQDELVKQMVYRAKVQAKALIEGQAGGLTGDELRQYVTGKYYDAFDPYGRATDSVALQEAKTATYQNDLNPTGHFVDLTYATAGYSMQRALQNNPLGRILLPFLRTPVNLFRQSVQLTPGLNLLQAEYRDAIRGIARPGEAAELAAQRQAQAIGQFGMGLLAGGAGITLAYQGLVTGSAPFDPKLAAEATADGWRPHSIVIPHADGSRTYIPFDRFDPVMLPFAMGADLMNILKSDEPADLHKKVTLSVSLALSLAKALTDKLYLQSFSQTLDAIQNPDRSFGKWAGKMAENYVPFASAARLINPDPVMREANDFTSAALGRTVGFSSQFPARRDWAGDPITVHKGLWHDTPADVANAEVERLALQQGGSVGAPAAKTKGETDLRDITLAGNADPQGKGVNAYDRFQELAGHPERMPGSPPNAKPLRQAAAELIQRPEYQRMPDGDASTRGTKSATLMSLINGYRSGARGFMAADNNVRAAEYAETLRVAKANGYVTPNMPTSANTADGLVNRLGKMFGFSGAHAPSPATPTTDGTTNNRN